MPDLHRLSTSKTLSADQITMSYDSFVVGENVTVQIPPGSFTIIIGPNACGKSTLLRCISRLLRPTHGAVYLDGKNIHSMRAKDFARQVSLLSQSALVPSGISVRDLVTRGRYPHQTLVSRWSQADEKAVNEALAATHLTNLADRMVDELSGGQRQRAWVAMALAQDSPILLLDEPTTYLDIAHQINLLDLFSELNATTGRTLVAVLHDINHALAYASHLIAMKDGAIVAQGIPEQVVTCELLFEVFGVSADVITDPVNGGRMIVPRHHNSTAPCNG